ncbi:MAG: resolvase [Pirellula sp.]|nr:resolvase [Pirellula sp.]
MKAIIAYYRVSTKRQGVSGLGLDDQRAAVRAYAASTGSRIVAEFTEVETGKRSDRPELAAAVARARASRGTLVIGKLDRLARNVYFVSGLMESKVPFVACDNPHATPLTIHILAAVAENEARAISDRTKAALAQAKRRGVLLGTHNPLNNINWRKGKRNGLAKAVAKAADVRSKARSDSYGFLMPEVHAMRETGLSYAAIATKLNDAGHVTTTGKAFAAMTVQRLIS